MLPWSVIPTAGWPSAAAAGDDVGDPGRAVEHGELGVQMQVGEGRAHGLAASCSVRTTVPDRELHGCDSIPGCDRGLPHVTR